MVSRMHATARKIGHVISVLVGVSAPPEAYLEPLHVMNTSIHVVLLALWVLASVTIGFPFAPVARTLKEANGKTEVLTEESRIIPVAWIWLVMFLLGCDVSRMRTFLSVSFPKRDNRVDMRWHSTLAMVMPILICIVVTMTGPQDVVTLIHLMALMCVANIFSLSAEELQGLIISTSVQGPHDVRIDLISLLSTSSIVCLIFGAVPLINTCVRGFIEFGGGNAVNDGMTMTVLQLVMSLMASIFVGSHILVQICNHAMYNKLHTMRPDRCNLLPFYSDDRHDPVRDEPVPHVSDVEQFPVVKFPTTRPDYMVTSSVSYKSGNEAGSSTTSHPVLHEPIERALVVPVDTANEKYYVTPVGPCNFPSTIIPDHCNEPVVYLSDTEFEIYRKHVGVLVRWRRFYVLSQMMNILLFMILVDMTGFLQTIPDMEVSTT